MKEEHRLMLALAENEKSILKNELEEHPHDTEERQWKLSRISECDHFIVKLKSLYSRKNAYGLKDPVIRVKIRNAWDSIERAKIYKTARKPR